MELLFVPPTLSPKPFSHLQSTRAVRCTNRSSSSSISSSPPTSSAGKTTPTKKKRPPRPSFEEQALRRWSARNPSRRLSFPWQQQKQPQQRHQENAGGAHSPGQETKKTTSATLQSIVDYFYYSSDGDGGVGDEEGAGKNGIVHVVQDTELQQQGLRGLPDSHWPRKVGAFPIGSTGVSAPWMHGGESTESKLGWGSVEGDDEGADKDGVYDQQLHKEPLTGSSEGELYHQGGSQYSDFDKSVRYSSVNAIVGSLRNSIQKDSSSLAIEESDSEDLTEMLGPVLLPWEREEEDFDGGGLGKSSNTELAERTIPEPELRRLRNVALRMKERMRIGPGGVTQAVVESVHMKWQEDELVKMRFEGPPSLNMKRTHELLEDRTGGIVIWRSGRSLVLYRGMNYKLRCVQSYAKVAEDDSNQKFNKAGNFVPSHGEQSLQNIRTEGVDRSSSAVSSSQEDTNTFDIDSFLDQLGPRYKDWSGRSPLPVDADLLPGVVPGYKPPFRLLPYKTKSTLKNREMTSLRRLARQTTPHFALGRNRQHQGLATAIVKLWEKSAIVKIAIKRGIPNTCNDRMAEEIKQLTGGVLLSRNKEYIVLYRGNDFVTPKVRQVLVEKRQQAITQQDEEELARLRASASITAVPRTLRSPLVAGTLAETTEAKFRWGDPLNSEEREKEKKDLALAKHASLLKNLERKLALAKAKVAKAEKALAKVQEFLAPAELPTDLETVTDEERFLFRRIGLKMRAFLLVGRREVFDGTIQNMHLHWKHRELVKILVKGKSFAQVKHIAVSLEAESGGVLISLDKTTKGYAIIFYRGKNYNRPQILKPHNLLTRRQALARSIELQRREALNHHISNLQDTIQKMKLQLEQMKAAKERQDEDLLTIVEDDLLLDDDNIVDEGEEAYLQTYSSSDEDDANDRSNVYF